MVHGSGLDEITTTGATAVAAWRHGALSTFNLAPEAFGFARISAESLRGGEPSENAAALRALLDGAVGPYRDIVLFNAAASLVVADLADGLEAGLAKAAESIDSGRAGQALDRLAALSQEPA